MGTPSITKGQPLADVLAKLLGRSFDNLAKADRYEDDEIYIRGLAENSTYQNRVAMPFSYRTDICENIYIVDNGNGKLDPDDLLLHADGYYQEKVQRSSGFLGLGSTASLEFAFRYARLGVARFHEKSGYEAAGDDRLPANVMPIVAELKRSYGATFSVIHGTTVSRVGGALEAACNIANDRDQRK